MTARNTVPGPQAPPGGVKRHGARAFDATEHDPYFARHKAAGPTFCRDCGAVFRAGRWTWGEAPAEAHSDRCPACQRIHDHLPAGTVVLEGAFVDEHRADLAGLVRNVAERALGEHPLGRIMAIEDQPLRMTVTTTDLHLPRRIGDALEAAWDGELDVRYAEDEYRVDVRWKRW